VPRLAIIQVAATGHPIFNEDQSVAIMMGKMRTRLRDLEAAFLRPYTDATAGTPDGVAAEPNGQSATSPTVADAGDLSIRRGWLRMRPFLGESRWAIVALVTASVVAGATEAGILAILAQAAVALVNGSRIHLHLGPLHAEEDVGVLLEFAVALALARLALQGVISAIPARITADLEARLRGGTFAAFSRASWAEQSRDREGHLQELATNQVSLASTGATQSALVIVSFTCLLVLVASALVLNVVAAFGVVLAALGLFALLRPLSTVGHRQAHASSRASLNYAGGINEAVRVAEETKVFGVAGAQRQKIGGLVRAVQIPVFRVQLIARLVPGIYQSLIYLLVAGALALLYTTGTGHIAALGAVVLLLVRAGSYGQQVQASYTAVRQALPYLERIQQVQQRYDASTPLPGQRRLAAVNVLALEHVSFAYEPSRPTLSDITFAVSGGETVGIVGPTGAGKSTLVQIILGLREPSSGRYLIDGTPAHQFRHEDWCKAFTYLPQEPRLLHASVADNIRFFRHLSDDAVEHAARLAGIHSDIVKWPKGYNTVVGPRADAVSGGQQQRICLARALASQPQVLVLDEPTSALDPHAEQLIRESLAALKGRLTLFVVAHRLSTLDSCERVMVIIDGRLQAFDTPGALLSDSAYYRSASALATAPVAQG
jgi:ATP-binding cassette subfamily B protein